MTMVDEMTTLESELEALLFVSDEPVSAGKLAEVLEMDAGDVVEALANMAVSYEDANRGIQLREVAGGWRLYTHPAHHEIIERYVISWDTQKLSQAALEALAVIAYNQPATRNAVASIRGVNSDAVISSLVEKGLVKEAGHEMSPGSPILYATTRTFLESFGLKTLRELPRIEDFAPDEESRSYIERRLSAHRPDTSTVDLDGSSDEDDELADEDSRDDSSYAYEDGELDGEDEGRIVDDAPTGGEADDEARGDASDDDKGVPTIEQIVKDSITDGITFHE